MRWYPELNPQGETEGGVTVNGNLPVDRIPQVQPQLFMLAILVLKAKIISLVGNAQVFADLQ